jgi:hypothetical protein
MYPLYRMDRRLNPMLSWLRRRLICLGRLSSRTAHENPNRFRASEYNVTDSELVQRETQEIRDDLETFKVAVEERWLLSSSEAFSAEMPIAIFERDNRAKAQSHLQHPLIQIHMIERR